MNKKITDLSLVEITDLLLKYFEKPALPQNNEEDGLQLIMAVEIPALKTWLGLSEQIEATDEQIIDCLNKTLINPVFIGKVDFFRPRSNVTARRAKHLLVLRVSK